MMYKVLKPNRRSLLTPWWRGGRKYKKPLLRKEARLDASGEKRRRRRKISRPRWTKSRGKYKLYVFTDLTVAKAFAKVFDGVVWECEVNGYTTYRSSLRLLDYPITRRRSRIFSKCNMNYTKTPTHNSSKHVAGCAAIKLIKIVR